MTYVENHISKKGLRIIKQPPTQEQAALQNLKQKN